MTENIFGNATPASTNLNDSANYALGVGFTTSVNGNVTGIRWRFPDTLPTSTVTCGLYRASDQALLASTSFSSPTAGAWNEVTFGSPVAVTASTEYVATIWTSDRYVATTSYSWPVTSGSLTAVASNGRLAVLPGSLSYPGTVSGNAANFFVDVIFDSGVTPAATKPLVVTGLVRPGPGQAWLVRSTLADPPVLTTRGPLVATSPPRPAPASVPQLVRGALFDAATPGPLVVTPAGPVPRPAVMLVRASLVDAAPPAAGTPAPIVVTAGRPPSPVGVVLVRGSLADDPVLTTRPPVMATAIPPAPPVSAPLLVRSPAPDVVAPASATPGPVLVTAPQRPPAGQAWLVRSTLADPPVLTSPAPLVVTAPSRPVPVTPPALVRASLADLVQAASATPAPLVVTGPVRPGPGQAWLVRATLADPPVLTTRPPLVVTPVAVPIPAAAVLCRGSLVDVAAPPRPVGPRLSATSPRGRLSSTSPRGRISSGGGT